MRKKNPQISQTTKRKHGEDFYSRIAKESTKAWIANGRKPRGFAAMSPEKRQELALKGAASRRRRKDVK